MLPKTLDLEEPERLAPLAPQWDWHYVWEDTPGDPDDNGNWLNHLFLVDGWPDRRWSALQEGRALWYEALCGAKTASLSGFLESHTALCRECRRRREECVGGPSAWAHVLDEPRV